MKLSITGCINIKDIDVEMEYFLEKNSILALNVMATWNYFILKTTRFNVTRRLQEQNFKNSS